ncbi:MAG TPA: CDP-alcohol phosphatidyltransferase family protein, partial [Vicinamibacterales bacterium]|nr:CDP-alcohol phosphatidyltransferase family protein [Vicinamibacterales bacterium]
HQGLLDSLINWHFSARITRVLSYTRIRPNDVTFAAAAVGALACALVAAGAAPGIAAGGVLLQLQSILDSCDGELARLTFRTSPSGQWLDNILDDLIDNMFVCCAGFASGGNWIAVGLLSACARGLSMAFAYHDVYRRTGTGDVYRFRLWFEGRDRSAEDLFKPNSPPTIVRALGRRDTYVFLWMILCIVNLTRVIVMYGAVLAAIQAVAIALHLAMREPLPAPETE